VEKIKRDLKITTIFEGTSEIQRNIISLFRLRETVRSKGKYYLEMAEGLDRLPGDCGAGILSHAIRILNEIILQARKLKINRSQYVMFLLADMMTWCEVGEALCQKASGSEAFERTPEFMKAAARLFAREVVEKVSLNGLKLAHGCGQVMDEVAEKLNTLDIGQAMQEYLKDMDIIAAELVK
jgi:alkylation response protein AidB-like acyl-CoA dehydrogenase